jgi:hypothetical protein
MSSLTHPNQFAALGIPAEKLELLAKHLDKASQYVFEKDEGPDEALVWLWQSLNTHLPFKDAELVHAVAARNYHPKAPEYNELGYDSCQSHRELSKVVSEAILLGGLIYEGESAGLTISLTDAKAIIQSEFVMDDTEAAIFARLASTHGSQQDFIFPGVTPSPGNTDSLEDLALKALSGHPATSVRTLTGVGGMRADQDWNHVTDLATFAELKITEDKRYYPGLGVFYLLMTLGSANLPSVQALAKSQPKVYAAFMQLEHKLKNTAKIDYQGVGVLCSSYIPKWHELKPLEAFANSGVKDLSAHFHSPSYEFAGLVAVLKGQLDTDHAITALYELETALQHAWSFNSTIHLPWTAQLADLSNDLMGKITNQVGDQATRYGVSYNGSSLEVVEYHFGTERRFPFGVAGTSALVAKLYPSSDKFAGEHQSTILQQNSPLLAEISKLGFLRAALRILESS